MFQSNQMESVSGNQLDTEKAVQTSDTAVKNIQFSVMVTSHNQIPDIFFLTLLE